MCSLILILNSILAACYAMGAGARTGVGDTNKWRTNRDMSVICSCGLPASTAEQRAIYSEPRMVAASVIFQYLDIIMLFNITLDNSR